MIHTDGIRTIANAPAPAPALPEDPETPDFVVQNEGSIFLVFPCTPQATEWLAENVEEPQRFGSGIVVEHGYIVDLVDGIADAGFTVI